MSPLRPPQQQRSRATLDRIVGATRRLLEGEGFDRLSVARIAREARSSVGVVYSRFGDKRGLLAHLADVYAQEAQVEVQAFARGRARPPGDAAPQGLEAEVRAVVAFVVRFHRERAGWVRALLQDARAHPDGPTAERMRGLKALPPSLARLLLTDRARIGHPDPQAAVARGFFLVVSAVRERVLFGEGQGSDDELVDLLTAAWAGVLNPRSPAERVPGAPGPSGRLYS